MANYRIGIDTGGTYTDAVLVDTESGVVLETAKQPTTHYDLARGTARALEELLQKSSVGGEEIAELCLSTTLATNAVVENKGARVGLFVIGYVKHFRLPVVANVFVKGGHTIAGDEEEPLDIEHIVDTIEGLKNEVDAYAVCASMAVENPTHELVTEKAISMIDPKPVFCSHRVSIHAGMRERAATAALHAKLMPLMEDYLAGIQAAMIREKISCPVSVVSGNGRPISMDDAVQQAGATVASGPACTAEFGAMQTEGDGLVVDVGGTTTDIAMIKSGRVLLAEDGCRIGQWQTHVEAVDMYTGGIGGDSLVRLADKGGMEIGPSRVVPLAVAQSLPPVDQWLGTGEQAKCISLPPEAEVGNDPVICAIEKNGPATPEMLNQLTGQSGMMLDKELENLARNQLIVESGFTPTDALIVLGRVELGERQPAEEGAAVLAEVAGLKVTEFCEEVVRRTEEKIENLIIDYLIYRSWGKSMAAFISGRNSHPELSVNFGLKIPIIGIGAAARSLLPAVADRLGTTVSFPQHCEVGNAMGAAFISTVEKLQPSGAVD